MRKKEKEIVDKELLEKIIRRAKVCRIAMSLNEIPYVIPVNYGYKDNYLYIHSAREGKKLDILKQNNNVCVEMEIINEIIKADQPCKWSMKYQSMIGFGKAEIIDNIEEKIEALNILMDHYSPGQVHKFQERLIEKIVIIKIHLENITGKQSI
ncbi:MAG: pyridoxamine 5'-phosphate oxidase family protein [Promethearchaeota archaeon]